MIVYKMPDIKDIHRQTTFNRRNYHIQFRLLHECFIYTKENQRKSGTYLLNSMLEVKYKSVILYISL
jgi:hypothetical protein